MKAKKNKSSKPNNNAMFQPVKLQTNSFKPNMHLRKTGFSNKVKGVR